MVVVRGRSLSASVRFEALPDFQLTLIHFHRQQKQFGLIWYGENLMISLHRHIAETISAPGREVSGLPPDHFKIRNNSPCHL
jgi:hypothetical protein